VAVYWFDTGPNGPWCRKPEWWQLIARDGGEWQELGKKVGEDVRKDTYDVLTFEPVTVRQLRIVAKLPPQWSGGILEWRVGRPAAAPTASAPHKAFSLRGDEAIVVPEAKRKFSDSYLYFCSTGRATGRPIGRYGPNSLVNWLNVQGVPTRIPAYHAGAAGSRLITMLKAGHNRVKLSQQEMDKIACWIDLLVPYCGDYRESHAWSPRELADYEARVKKREASEAQERESIQAFVQHLAQGGRRRN